MPKGTFEATGNATNQRLQQTGHGVNASPILSVGGVAEEGVPMGKSLADAKRQIIKQVEAVMDYLPDDIDEAEELEPWLFWQVDQFVQALRRPDLNILILGGMVGLLGTAFSATLPGDSSGEQGGLPRLRAV